MHYCRWILITFLFFYFLFPKNILAAPVTGIFDSVDTVNWKLNGWAYDPDSPSASITIRVNLEGPTGVGYVLGDFPTNVNRPDVNSTYNLTGTHGFSISLPIHLQNLFHTFYLYGIDINDSSLSPITFSPKTSLEKPNSDLSISGLVDNSPMTISTSSRTAGSIDSLIWKNKQFINVTDHGRELQSASSFDGYGECFNPTEAGNYFIDGDGPNSSSVLNYSSTTSNSLTTIISPAYWTVPGQACEKRTNPVNTTIVSDHLIRKDVTIGVFNLPNVTEYRVTYFLPIAHSVAIFEVLTGYMTNDFTAYWTYNPATNALNSISNRPAGEQPLPLIFSTPDKQYAMGVYSRDLPQSTFSDAGYGRFDFSGDPNWGTNKWNCVYRIFNPAAGSHTFTCYFAVGSLETVRSSLQQLYQHFQTPTSTPTTVPLLGDANQDGKVNLMDFSVWKNEYLNNQKEKADFNQDNKVDLLDFNIWKSGYLK